ncbi:hypothetical protein [Streptomyces sp. NPDC058295]|uniref:hypothetical protein n=1 Tax=Streptomyces sp. NPDC058295 TaxID=3346431 RepID=UPI0036E41771
MVTSRVIGYQRTALDGAGFSHFMLQDLDEVQIGEFSGQRAANAAVRWAVCARMSRSNNSSRPSKTTNASRGGHHPPVHL